MDQREFEREIAILADMKRRIRILDEAVREMKERRAAMQEQDEGAMRRLREKLGERT